MYYNNRRTDSQIESGIVSPGDPTYWNYSKGMSLRRGSVDQGFRTKAPTSGTVSIVPDSVADPYTIFSSQQALKRDVAVKGGFDARAFRVDKGHPWDLMKYELSGDPWSFVSKYGREYKNVRPWALPSGAGAGGFDLALPRTDLASYGALQWGSASPLSDRFSFSAFTGELREGLPKFTSEVMRSRTKHIRGVGGDYLNAQFGWIPLLNDLRGIASALANASVGLYQPAGATHRQRKEKPTEVIWSGSSTGRPITIATGNYADPLLLKGAGTGLITDSFAVADISNSIRAVRRRWFEGEYVYLPEAGFDATKYEDRLATLFKTEITPSDLWQLSPWSWFVDWFADIGGALEAAEAATSNRILSTYAYAMESIDQEIIVMLSDIRAERDGYYSGPSRVVNRYKTTSYRRIRANPYGFTPNPSVNLSPGQLGILGALGLKKLT